MAKVELKAPIIEEIKSHLDGATGVVVADYRGLTVEQDTALRKKFREAGVFYKVYKNTFIKRAIAGTEFESLVETLEGPTAVAFSKSDSTAGARIMYQFAKDVPVFEIKAGVIESTFYDKSSIVTIASLPGKDELLGRLFGSMKSPISNFARVIKQIADKKEG